MNNITQFYADLVAEAVQRGELSEAVRPEDVVNLLVAISEGISKLATRSSSNAHRRAVQVLELMLEGRLLDTTPMLRGQATSR
jgi:hypothetical protein